MKNKIKKILTWLTTALTIGTIFGCITLSLYMEDITAPSDLQSLPMLPNISIKENLIMSNSKASNSPIVRLLLPDGSFICSGSIVDSKYVLTAAHCLVDELGYMTDKILVCINNDFSNTCEVVTPARPAIINRSTDNALIIGNFSGFKSLKINTTSDVYSSNRSNVETCGYPYGDKGVCFVTAFKPTPMLYKVSIGGMLFPGMSGGPVHDKTANEVIGVNSAVGHGFIVITTLIGLSQQLQIGVENE